MYRSTLVLVASLAIASSARAGVVVTVGDDLVGGLFDPGATVNMNITLTQDPPGNDIGIRSLQFDLTETDPALVPANFAFDFGDVMLGEIFYMSFPTLPVPSTGYTGVSPTSPLNMGMLVLPAGAHATLASFDVTLPASLQDYTVDVVHGTALDPNLGFALVFGFGGVTPPTIWRVDTGEAFGGTGLFRPAPDGVRFTFVPEPASLVLLAAGALALLRRRCP